MAIETSFQLAEIKGLRDNRQYKENRLAKLSEQLRFEHRKQQRDPSLVLEPQDLVDILEISTVTFYLNVYCLDNKLFSTSILEINHKLQAHTPPRDIDEDQAKLLAKLPKSFCPFIEDFSKATSNVLPLRRLYDYKIKLKVDYTLSYRPLYSQNTEELVVLKKYLLENLNKGFIKPS